MPSTRSTINSPAFRRWASIARTSPTIIRADLLGGDIFDAAVSLDCNPFDVKRLFDKYGLTISSVAAHAHLLDPTHPGALRH